MAYQYPASALDRKDGSSFVLGTHWSETYDGQDILLSHLRGKCQLEKQTINDVNETENCLSRQDVPLYHTRLWELLALKESELNEVQISVLRYGEGAVYGYQTDGKLYLYGERLQTNYSFPLPTNLTKVPLIFNRMTDPSATFTSGLDYYIDLERGSIVFRENPFNNPLVAIRDTIDTDGITDRECGLWMFNAKFDLEQVQKHWGFVLGLEEEETSQNYKDLINTILDALVQGTSKSHLVRAIAAITDVPFAAGNEIVEDVYSTVDNLFVLTDANVYKYSPEATALVEIGDEVLEDDALSDAVQLFEFNRGVVPDDLLALTMGKGLLSFGYFSGITFENKVVDLELTEDDDGNTRVEFEVGGFSADIEKFWDDIHAAGVAAGQTLAQLMDERLPQVTTVAACDIREETYPTSQPTAQALPITINPLEFLVQNVLRNNACVVKIRAAALGTNKLDLARLSLLRKIVPPHTVVLFVVELVADAERIILGETTEDGEPGWDIEVSTFAAPSIIEDTIPTTLINDENCQARYVYGRCI